MPLGHADVRSDGIAWPSSSLTWARSPLQKFRHGRGIPTAMTLDIRGSLKNTKISANRYVVFEEMISNSIDAFLIRQDESPSDIDLRIMVTVRLFATDL